VFEDRWYGCGPVRRLAASWSLAGGSKQAQALAMLWKPGIECFALSQVPDVSTMRLTPCIKVCLPISEETCSWQRRF
jgi:hypothetical protein